MQLTVEDGAVVLQWRLVCHFNQIVIISTFPDATSNICHISTAPPVVWSMDCRINAVWVSNSNQQETLNIMLNDIQSTMAILLMPFTSKSGLLVDSSVFFLNLFQKKTFQEK